MAFISRVKTWIGGEVLTATALNAEFDNAIESQLPYPSGALQGSVLYLGSATWDALATGTAGQALVTAGAGANPAWAGMTTHGDVEFHNGTTRTRLAAGSAGQFLASGGAGADCYWEDAMVNPMTTRGDMIFYGASGTTRLATGTAGQALISGGASADLSWAGMTTQGDIEYHNGTTRTRLAIGTPTYVLTVNDAGTGLEWADSTVPDGAITSAKLLDYTAGDNLLASADTQRNSSATSYTLVKEIELCRGGTLRIKFDLKTATAPYTGYGRVYRNGSPVGTEQTNATTSYVTKSEDISGWSAGDLCQLYYHGTSSILVFVRNFRVYSGDRFLYTETVNTD